MNGVLEAKQFEAHTDDEAVEAIVVITTADSDLEELVRRCRELLAKQNADQDCPPGHWLG
jgi:hypothetical protein